MPRAAWSAKRERQYEHIKDSLLERGESESTAEEIAARTVNKERAQHCKARGGEIIPSGIAPYFINSFVISIPAAIFPLVLALMAAYGLAWVLPVVAVIVGGAFVYSRTRKMVRTAPTDAATQGAGAPGQGAASADEYAQKLDEELKHYD